MSLMFLRGGGGVEPVVLDFWEKDFYQNFQLSLGVDFFFFDTAKTGKLSVSSKVL